MHLFQSVAPYIGREETIIGVIGGLLAWACASGFYLIRGTQRLAQALDRASSVVASAPTGAEFAARYELLAGEIEAIAPLRERWREFSASLILPTKPGRPIRTAARPEMWFNLDLMRAQGVEINTRYHAGMPNFLVGAGLLFTFFGLAVALASAGGIVDGGSEPKAEIAAPAAARQEGLNAAPEPNAAPEFHQQSERNKALKQLLDTASFKFTTSLTGLLLSILYSMMRNSRLRRVEGRIDRFVALIEARAPLATSAALQQEANGLIERQLVYAESLANDLALALQNALDQVFDSRLSEHIGPLREAMEAMSARVAGGNEDAIGKMLESFLQQLRGGADDKMQDVAATLERLGGRLDDLQTGLGEAAARMAQSADAMAQRMGEGAEAALTRITDQMNGVVEQLRLVAEDTRRAGSETGGELARQIDAAAKNFETASRGIGEALADAARRLGENLGAQSSESEARLRTQIEAMVEQLRALAETSRDAGGAALQAVADRIGAAAGAFEASAQKIAAGLEQAASGAGGAFSAGAEQAVQRIAEATEAMRRDLAALTTDLGESGKRAGEALNQGGAAGAEAVKAALGQAGGVFNASAEQAAEALKTVLGQAGARLEAASQALDEAGRNAGAALQKGGEAAGAAFGGEAARLGDRASALTRASEGAAAQITALTEAARDAVAPLRATSGDLAGVTAALGRAAEQMTSAARGAGEAASQLGGAMQRFEATQASARGLVEGLGGAVDRFASLDKELAGVVSALETGMKAFAQEVTRCVNDTDKALAGAVTHLHHLIDELQQLLEPK